MLLLLIVMPGATLGVISIVMALDVALFGEAHELFEVSKQVTISLLAKVLEVNMLLLLPWFAPLTIH